LVVTAIKRATAIAGRRKILLAGGRVRTTVSKANPGAEDVSAAV
jgi:hypothetical protein